MQRQPATDLESTGCHLPGLQGIKKCLFFGLHSQGHLL